jgi:hypothetical protein
LNSELAGNYIIQVSFVVHHTAQYFHALFLNVDGNVYGYGLNKVIQILIIVWGAWFNLK